MALIAVAADKGAPGVTTASVVLAAVWPRPAVLAECDPAGGDLVYRFPAASGGRLDPRRGLLSLAVAARRGMTPQQVAEHLQTLRGGLAVLTGVSTAEQGAGLEPLWGVVGNALSQLPGTDVIADCGRLGADGPYYDLLAQASAIVLIARHNLGEVVRLRERIPALTMALGRRDRVASAIRVVVIADHKRFHTALGEVGQALGHGKGTSVIGGLAYEPRTARQLCGEWGGRLDKSLLARTARDVAGQLAAVRPAFGGPGSSGRRERTALALPLRARPDPAPRPGARAPWEDPGPGTGVTPAPSARGRHAGHRASLPAGGGMNGGRSTAADGPPPWWFTGPGDGPDAGTAG